jgi:hypothetical protein
MLITDFPLILPVIRPQAMPVIEITVQNDRVAKAAKMMAEIMVVVVRQSFGSLGRTNQVAQSGKTCDEPSESRSGIKVKFASQRKLVSLVFLNIVTVGLQDNACRTAVGSVSKRRENLNWAGPDCRSIFLRRNSISCLF